MIRTAILAGLLLVMLSMAYGKSMLTGPTPGPIAAQTNAPPEHPRAPEVAAAPAARPAPVVAQKPAPSRDVATVRENLLPPREPEMPVLPAPEPVVQAPPVAAIVPPQPVVAAMPPAPVLPPVTKAPESVPAPPAALDMPLPLLPPAMMPVEEMPVRQVATPRVMTPRELPLTSEREVAMSRDDGPPADAPVEAAPSDPAAVTGKAALSPSTAPTPQLMTREERTRELYRLARDMEDTFIEKLAH